MSAELGSQLMELTKAVRNLVEVLKEMNGRTAEDKHDKDDTAAQS